MRMLRVVMGVVVVIGVVVARWVIVVTVLVACRLRQMRLMNFMPCRPARVNHPVHQCQGLRQHHRQQRQQPQAANPPVGSGGLRHGAVRVGVWVHGQVTIVAQPPQPIQTLLFI